jgi:hypothetical protein
LIFKLKGFIFMSVIRELAPPKFCYAAHNRKH